MTWAKKAGMNSGCTEILFKTELHASEEAIKKNLLPLIEKTVVPD